MAATVRVRRRVSSRDLPELEEFMGKDVEIVVTELVDVGPADQRPLRGSVLKYEDPFGPAVPEEDWDALQ